MRRPSVRLGIGMEAPRSEDKGHTFESRRVRHFFVFSQSDAHAQNETGLICPSKQFNQIVASALTGWPLPGEHPELLAGHVTR
jgi:hypothetical protein